MVKSIGPNYSDLFADSKYDSLTAALKSSKSGSEASSLDFSFAQNFKVPEAVNFSNSFLNADLPSENYSFGTTKTNFSFPEYKPSTKSLFGDTLSTDIFSNFTVSRDTSSAQNGTALKTPEAPTLTGQKLIDALKMPSTPSFTNASSSEGVARLVAALERGSPSQSTEATTTLSTEASADKYKPLLDALARNKGGETQAVSDVVSDVNPNFVGYPSEGVVANAIPIYPPAGGPLITPQEAAAALEFIKKLAPAAKAGPVALLTGAILGFLAQPTSDLKALERELPGTKIRDEGGVRTLYDSEGNALISSKKDWFGVSRWDVNEQNLGRYKQRLEDVASGQSKPQPVVSTGEAPAAVLPNENTPRLPGVDYSLSQTKTPGTTEQRTPSPTKQQLVEQTADIILDGLRAQGQASPDRDTLINEIITWQRGKSGTSSTVDQTAKDLRTLLQPGADGFTQKVLQGIIGRATPSSTVQTTQETRSPSADTTQNTSATFDIDWPQGRAWNPDSAPVNNSFYETLQRTFAQPEENPAPTTTAQTRTQADNTPQNTAQSFEIDGVTYGFYPALRITPDMEYRPSAETLSMVNALNSGTIEFGETPIGDATLFQRTTGPTIFAPVELPGGPNEPEEPNGGEPNRAFIRPSDLKQPDKPQEPVSNVVEIVDSTGNSQLAISLRDTNGNEMPFLMRRQADGSVDLIGPGGDKLTLTPAEVEAVTKNVWPIREEPSTIVPGNTIVHYSNGTKIEYDSNGDMYLNLSNGVGGNWPPPPKKPTTFGPGGDDGWEKPEDKKGPVHALNNFLKKYGLATFTVSALGAVATGYIWFGTNREAKELFTDIATVPQFKAYPEQNFSNYNLLNPTSVANLNTDINRFYAEQIADTLLGTQTNSVKAIDLQQRLTLIQNIQSVLSGGAGTSNLNTVVGLIGQQRLYDGSILSTYTTLAAQTKSSLATQITLNIQRKYNSIDGDLSTKVLSANSTIDPLPANVVTPDQIKAYAESSITKLEQTKLDAQQAKAELQKIITGAEDILSKEPVVIPGDPKTNTPARIEYKESPVPLPLVTLGQNLDTLANNASSQQLTLTGLIQNVTIQQKYNELNVSDVLSAYRDANTSYINTPAKNLGDIIPNLNQTLGRIEAKIDEVSAIQNELSSKVPSTSDPRVTTAYSTLLNNVNSTLSQLRSSRDNIVSQINTARQTTLTTQISIERQQEDPFISIRNSANALNANRYREVNPFIPSNTVNGFLLPTFVLPSSAGSRAATFREQVEALYDAYPKAFSPPPGLGTNYGATREEAVNGFIRSTGLDPNLTFQERLQLQRGQ